MAARSSTRSASGPDAPSARSAASRSSATSEFLRGILPLMEMMSRYFDAEVERLRERSGARAGAARRQPLGRRRSRRTPRSFFAAWYRARGLERPLVGLAFDAAFGIPWFRDLMRKIGEVPANRATRPRARRSACRCWSIPAAITRCSGPGPTAIASTSAVARGSSSWRCASRVPVVPVVSHGGHDSICHPHPRRMARTARRDRTRFVRPSFPIALQIPWGISPVGLPGDSAAGEDHHRGPARRCAGRTSDRRPPTIRPSSRAATTRSPA